MGAIEVAELTAGRPAHEQEAEEEAQRHFAAMRELVDGAAAAVARRDRPSPPLSVAG
jgi:hypothetical protein